MNAPKVLIKMAEKENTGRKRKTGAVKNREERRYRFLKQEVVMESGHFKLYFQAGKS